MANVFGNWGFIPGIAGSTWLAPPVETMWSMFTNKSGDLDKAMDEYVSGSDMFGEYGDEGMLEEEASDAVDQAIMQLHSPVPTAGLVPGFGPALTDQELQNVVQNYPGIQELATVSYGDMDNLFDQAQDFMDAGGEDFDNFVTDLEDLAEDSGIDLWDAIKGVGNAITDAATDVLGLAGEGALTQAEATVTQADTVASILNSGADWIEDRVEDLGQVVMENSKTEALASQMTYDHIMGDGISSTTQNMADKMDQEYQQDILFGEFETDWAEDPAAFLSFIGNEDNYMPDEAGGVAIDPNALEAWLASLFASGDPDQIEIGNAVQAQYTSLNLDGTGQAPGTGGEPTPEPTMTTDIPDTTDIPEEMDISDLPFVDYTDTGIDTPEDPGVEMQFDRPIPGIEYDPTIGIPVRQPSYWDQFNNVFNNLPGSGRFEAQQRKGDLFKDAETLFYLNTKWEDRDWLKDAGADPFSAGMVDDDLGGDGWVRGNMLESDAVNEEALFSDWLEGTYLQKPGETRSGLHDSVRSLRDNMEQFSGLSNAHVSNIVGQNAEGYDMLMDRAVFMSPNTQSENRLSNLVAMYNTHPGADTWVRNYMQNFFQNMLSDWTSAGRSKEDFLTTFVKDAPAMQAQAPRQPAPNGTSSPSPYGW